MTTETIIGVIAQGLILVGYFLTARWQTQKIKSLEETFKTQSDLLKNQADTIKTFEEYKKIINLTDVEKNIQLKIDNLHLEYKKVINAREKEVSDLAIQTAGTVFQRENKKMLRAWNELVNINAQFIMAQYPEINQKEERDEFINKFIPFNAEYVTPMIDAWFSGELQEFKEKYKSDGFLSDDNIQEEKEIQSQQDVNKKNQKNPS